MWEIQNNISPEFCQSKDLSCRQKLEVYLQIRKYLRNLQVQHYQNFAVANLGDLNGKIYPQDMQFAFQFLAHKVAHVNSSDLYRIKNLQLLSKIK